MDFLNSKQKQTVMMLHGTASNAKQWSQLSAELNQQYSVYAPEIPGYRKKQIETPQDFQSLDLRVKPLLDLLDSISEQIHLIGHSFGGLVALRLGELRPDKVLSITIYEPTVIGVFKGCTEPTDLALASEVKNLAEVVKHSSPEVAMESFINFWHGTKQWPNIPKSIQNKLCQYADIAAVDFLNGLEDLYQAQPHQHFQGQVNVIFGSKTVPLAKGIATKLGQKLPNAKMFELAGLGHMGPITHAQEFNNAIGDILRRMSKPVFSEMLA